MIVNPIANTIIEVNKVLLPHEMQVVRRSNTIYEIHTLRGKVICNCTFDKLQNTIERLIENVSTN